MAEVVLGIIAMLFCVAGAVSIIKWLALSLSLPQNNSDRVYAVILKGDDADIKLQMALETLEWDSGLKRVKAYAIDGGLDEVMREYCRELCKDSRIEFLEAEESKALIDLF